MRVADELMAWWFFSPGLKFGAVIQPSSIQPSSIQPSSIQPSSVGHKRFRELIFDRRIGCLVGQGGGFGPAPV